MLSRADNEFLTRSGKDTPMGELLRRYWQPVGGASELDRSPIKAIRILGENLAGFSKSTQRTIVHDNVAALYNIN